MKRLAAALLQTRLGRRLLLIFVLCAMVPVSLLAVLTLRGVSRHERLQTAGYLRLEAKSFAMAVLERLDLLERELLVAATADRTAVRRLDGSFVAAGSVAADGSGVLWTGAATAPTLGLATRARLARGRSAVVVNARGGGPPQLVLLVPDPRGGYLWGWVRPEELWKRGSTVPPRVELLLVTADGTRLIDSGRLQGRIDGRVVESWSRRSSANFEWSGGGVDYVATFWTIPMAGNFGTGNWTVALFLPEEVALAPVAAFRTSFVQVVVLALLAVLLAASWVIRHTLDPLRQLVEATRRVANRDFDLDLPRGGRTELHELSSAFRAMAEELQHHFADLAESARRLDDQHQRLAGLVEHSPYGVVLVDAAGRIELANGLARGYLQALGEGGDRPLRRLAGRPLAELYDWQELVLDGPPSRVFVVVVRQLSSDDEPPDTLVVLRDVTAERQLERQLQQQERLAAVGRLAAGMAHDLNNVLQAIGMCADLLRPEVVSEEALGDLDTLLSLNQRAAELIRQVLDFSRSSESAARPIGLIAALREALDLLRRALPPTIRLDFTVAPDAGDVMVSSDPVQLHQVLANLVLNARDAMPNGGTLDVAVSLASPTASGEERVGIVVRDTGVGIPLELQAKVFDPFFTTKPAGQGTGLGLSQVYGIVAQHGGTVHLQSQVGVGTEIRLLLPVLGYDAEGPAMAPPEAEPSSAEQPPRSRVLVVEDEPAVLHLARRHFELLGMKVTTAVNGRQAIELLDSSGPFDLVVCDVVMPELGGREVLREVRRRAPATSVVLMSGYAGPETETDETAQPDGWLRKPFTLEQLRQMVRQVLAADAAASAAEPPSSGEDHPRRA